MLNAKSVTVEEETAYCRVYSTGLFMAYIHGFQYCQKGNCACHGGIKFVHVVYFKLQLFLAVRGENGIFRSLQSLGFCFCIVISWVILCTNTRSKLELLLYQFVILPGLWWAFPQIWEETDALFVFHWDDTNITSNRASNSAKQLKGRCGAHHPRQFQSSEQLIPSPSHSLCKTNPCANTILLYSTVHATHILVRAYTDHIHSTSVCFVIWAT